MLTSRTLLICALLCTVVCATDCISTSQSGDLTLTSGTHTFQTCTFSGTLTLDPSSTVSVTGSDLTTAVASTNLITISTAGVYSLTIIGSTLALVGSGSRFITITAQMNAGSVLSVNGNVFTGVDAGIEATGAIVDVTTLSICDNIVDVMVAAGTRMAFIRLASVSVNGASTTFNVSGNARAVTSPSPYDVSVVGSLTVLEVVGDMQVGNGWWSTGVAVTYAYIDSNKWFQAVLVVGRISANWNCALISISYNTIRAKNVRNGSPIMLGEALGMNLKQWLPPLNITYNDYHLEQTTATADSDALLMFAAIFIGGNSLLNGFVKVLYNNVTMIASVEQGLLRMVGIALAVRTGSSYIGGFQAPLTMSYNSIKLTCGGPQCTAYAIGEVGGESLQISMNTNGMWFVIGNSGGVAGGVFAAFWVVTSTFDISNNRNLTITSNDFKLSSTSLVVYDLRLQGSINVGGPVTISDNTFYHTDASNSNAMISIGGDLNAGGSPFVITDNVVSGGNPSSPVLAADTNENVNGWAGSQIALCGNDMSGRVVYGSSNAQWVSDSCGYPANASISATTTTTTTSPGLSTGTPPPAPPGVAPTTSATTTTTTTTSPCAPNCTIDDSDNAAPGPTDSTGPTIGTGATVTATSVAALDTASTIQIAALLSIMACRTGGADSESARYLLSPLRIPGTGVVGDLVGSGLILLGGTALYLCVSMFVLRCVRSRAPKAGDAIAPEDMLPGDGPTVSEERARELGDLKVFTAKKWLFYPRVPLLLMVLLYTSIVNESARILFGNLHSSAEWWGILLAVIGMLYGLGVLASHHIVAIRVVNRMASSTKETSPHGDGGGDGVIAEGGGDKYKSPAATVTGGGDSAMMSASDLRATMGSGDTIVGAPDAMMVFSQISLNATSTSDGVRRRGPDGGSTRRSSNITSTSNDNNTSIVHLGVRSPTKVGTGNASFTSDQSSMCELEPSPQTQYNLYNPPPMDVHHDDGHSQEMGSRSLDISARRTNIVHSSSVSGGEMASSHFMSPSDDAFTVSTHTNNVRYTTSGGRQMRPVCVSPSYSLSTFDTVAHHDTSFNKDVQPSADAADDDDDVAAFGLVMRIPERSVVASEETPRRRKGSEPEIAPQLAFSAKDTPPTSDPHSDTWFIEYSPQDVEKQPWIIRNTLLAVGHWNTFVGRSMYCVVTTCRPQGVSWLVCHNLWRVFLVSVVAAISPDDTDDCRYVQGTIVAICIAHGLLVIVTRVYRIPALNLLQGLQSIFLGLMACSPFISDVTTQDGIGNTLLALSLLTALLSFVAIALEFQLQRRRSKNAYRETQ